MITKILIGTGSCGLAAGARSVLDFLKQNLPGLPIEEVGCLGHCYAEPLVEVHTSNGKTLHFGQAEATERFLTDLTNLGREFRLDPYPARTKREVLRVSRLCGKINPVNMDAYLAEGGYRGLFHALDKTPEAVIQDVLDSGLRGRGGGGFATGLKWRFLAAKTEDPKYLVCNADEGDPGAFMDRSLMESVPHQLIEGLLIGAYATGASEIIIYCRAEYPMAIKHLELAMADVRARGFNVLNGRTIEMRIKEGAGAFVCGEETALIHSLQGERGMPRFRPPFPTDSGFLGQPTLINNVETLANVPLILADGVDAYKKYGTTGSPGTKLFALAGDVPRPGLIEVPMGITLREIVYDIGGAEPGTVKAVQTGGPSGGCIPESEFDTPVDYDSLSRLGAIMGSGGLIVIGNNRCMVETSRYFLDFTHRESCGKCTFCRVGTRRMMEILERLTEGTATAKDLHTLEDLAPKIKKGSLCGLGQTAPNPVLAALRFFRDEFIEHLEEKSCRTGVCNPLSSLVIDHDACVRCKLCIKKCPTDAISADFLIDDAKCTRCNQCLDVCPKAAVLRQPRQTAKPEVTRV